MQPLHEIAIDLLTRLIATQSFSKEEEEVASIVEEFFDKHGVHSYKRGNNVWVKNQYFNPDC